MRRTQQQKRAGEHCNCSAREHWPTRRENRNACNEPAPPHNLPPSAEDYTLSYRLALWAATFATLEWQLRLPGLTLHNPPCATDEEWLCWAIPGSGCKGRMMIADSIEIRRLVDRKSVV